MYEKKFLKLLSRAKTFDPTGEYDDPRQGGLLIISPFGKEVKRITAKTAMIRNRLMIDLAENIAVGFMSKAGNLEKILKQSNKVATIIE